MVMAEASRMWRVFSGRSSRSDSVAVRHGDLLPSLVGTADVFVQTSLEGCPQTCSAPQFALPGML